MNVSIFRAAICVAAASTSIASAQYYAPSPAQSPYPRQQAVPAPVAATPSFRPINPVKRPTQPPLVANRTSPSAPTPAPATVRSVSKASSQPHAPLPPYQPSQPWVPPTPSMGYDANVSGYGGMNAGPMPQPATDYGTGGSFEGAPAGGCDTCDTGGGCGGCCGLCGHRCCIPLKTTGDLVQHMPFFGTTHGYYYFRPYHVMHVFSQQELVTRWGGDPRNPYDNCLFQQVYQQLGVDAKPTTTAEQSSVPTQEYVMPSDAMPTPVPYAPQHTPTPSYRTPNMPMVTPLPGVESVPVPSR